MAEKTCREHPCPEMAETCPECGRVMTRGLKPMTIHYKKLSTTFDMPGWYCACGEGIVTAKDMDVSDRQLNLLKAQAENLVLPSDICRIRKKLGLNQQDAGQVLGGGPSAFNKYEKGQVVPSKAISNLLRLLEAHPVGLTLLQNHSERAPL